MSEFIASKNECIDVVNYRERARRRRRNVHLHCNQPSQSIRMTATIADLMTCFKKWNSALHVCQPESKKNEFFRASMKWLAFGRFDPMVIVVWLSSFFYSIVVCSNYKFATKKNVKTLSLFLSLCVLLEWRKKRLYLYGFHTYHH